MQTPVTIRLNPPASLAAAHPFKEAILGIHRCYICSLFLEGSCTPMEFVSLLSDQGNYR